MNKSSRLDDKKKKLAEKNIGLVRTFYEKSIKNGKVPLYKKREFLSNLNYNYCRSALKYNEEAGFKFSTFAYGGFNFCIDNLKKNRERINSISFDEEKGKKIEDKKNIVDKDLLKMVFKNSELSNIEKKVIISYYYHGLSFSEIGKRYSYNKEKVRRIKNNAIKKIIKYSKKKDLVIEDFIKI
jgi:RNA polymerase sigma factor (sigma-70 family)